MGIPPGILQGVAIGAPVAGGLAQASAIRQQADAQAQASRYNAQLARAEGGAEADRIRRAGRRELGRQRTQLGASGVRVEGSPLDLLVANAAEIERDAVSAMIAARNTAALDEAQAKSAKRAGRTSAGASLLSGLVQGGTTALRIRGVI